MERVYLKQKNCLQIFMMLNMLLLIGFKSFATSYENADVIVGPNSTDAGNVYVDDENFALDSLKKIMNPNDFALATIYVSDYRKGNKEAENNLRNLISKYNSQNINQIMNYLLQDNKVRLLSTFSINHLNNDLIFVPMVGLVDSADANTTLLAKTFWNYVLTLAPRDFVDSINLLHIDLNKDYDNMATLCSSSTDASRWDINVDVRLLDPNNEEEVKKNIIYLMTYFYVLRTDQVEFLSPKKGNYSYDGRTYKDNSYINDFYRRFWKSRRNEINTNQYSLYKNEFLDTRASRTVYDDMAVSFYNYVTKGVMKRYLGFRADKTNFFNDYPFFKDLAKKLRINLGIKMS